MSNAIAVIEDNRVIVGSITFESAEHLSAYRIATRFDLHFPITVQWSPLPGFRPPC